MTKPLNRSSDIYQIRLNTVEQIQALRRTYPLTTPTTRHANGIALLRGIAALRSGTCLTDTYHDYDKYHYSIRCHAGHEWTCTLLGLCRANWCVECYRIDRRFTMDELHQLAEQRQGKCLSVQYVNGVSHAEWECLEGHRWIADASKVKQGHWCSRCRGRFPKDEYHAQLSEHAQRQGGKLLSSDYQGVDVFMEWQCAHGHQWRAQPMRILSGYWCGACVKEEKRKVFYAEYAAIAISRGGKLLSTRYINSAIKLEWRCDRGHIWAALPTSVRRGKWCLECAIVARSLHLKGRKRLPTNRNPDLGNSSLNEQRHAVSTKNTSLASATVPKTRSNLL